MLTVITVSVSGFHMMKTAHYTIQENSFEIKLLSPIAGDHMIYMCAQPTGLSLCT